MAVFETCPSQTRNPGKVEIFKQNILEKWKFQPILPWKNGNFGIKELEKMENFGKNILKKWKIQPISPWKNGNFGIKELGKMENFGKNILEKWIFFAVFTLEKWKFWD